MKARIAVLIALLFIGGIGADWWVDEITSEPEAGDVTKMDGPDGPPPSPAP